MLKTRTLTVDIDRPAEDVYRFLIEPANLAGWTMLHNGRRQPLAGPNSWTFDGPIGTLLVHFTPANPYLVVDYTTMRGAEVTHQVHARVIRNGAATVVTHTAVQPPTVSDIAFSSEEEWLKVDLQVLKTLMER